MFGNDVYPNFTINTETDINIVLKIVTAVSVATFVEENTDSEEEEK